MGQGGFRADGDTPSTVGIIISLSSTPTIRLLIAALIGLTAARSVRLEDYNYCTLTCHCPLGSACIFCASATCPASSEARVKRPNERFQLTIEVISRFGNLVRPQSALAARSLPSLISHQTSPLQVPIHPVAWF